MMNRLIATITFSALVLSLIFQFPGSKGQGQQSSRHEMCTEMSETLQEAVELQVISQVEADQISSNCFDSQELYD